MRGNNSQYPQVAVFCFHHSKRKTERARTGDIIANEIKMNN